MIYFISNGTYTKIGKANNPEKRIKELQTGCPEDLELKLIIEGNEEKERKIHKVLEKYRIRGEWFYIDFDYDEYLINFLLEQDNNEEDDSISIKGSSVLSNKYNWEILNKKLTSLEFFIAHSLSMSISKENCITIIDKNTTLKNKSKILGVSVNKINPILNKLIELDVICEDKNKYYFNKKISLKK
jgi:hypothetical protein